MVEDKGKLNFSFEEIFSTDLQNCDRKAEVLFYYQNLLSEDEKTSFEEHLGSCSECAGTLAGIEETEDAMRNTIVDPSRTEAILEKSRAKFAQSLNVKFGGKRTPYITPAEGPFHRRFEFRPYVNAMMVLLLLVLAYPAYRSFFLGTQVEQLSERLALQEKQNKSLQESLRDRDGQAASQKGTAVPILALSSIYSIRGERGAETETIDIAFNQETSTHTILFTVSEQVYPSYTVEISRDGKVLWIDDVSATLTPSGLISITLPSKFFKIGVYRLSIFGQSEKEKKLLTQVKLNIRAQ